MAKKAELLEQAHKLKLEVSNKNTILEIETAIKDAGETPEQKLEREAKLAKAGKHSAKGIKEEQEKSEKIEKQHHRDEQEEIAEQTKPKKAQKPARSRLERRSKGYKKLAELIDKDKEYTAKEAIDLAKKTGSSKFDASVELHIRLGVDPKQADQNIRDSIVLPSGTGKTVRVAVFAEDEDVVKAKSAGADIAGTDDFLRLLEKNEINFDVLISTPKMMQQLSKYAKVLGPRGLMPNPKSGTVTTNVEKAVKESKGGKVEYRVDGYGIIHLPIGKASFSEKQLNDNLDAIFASVKSAKPSSLKGNYVTSVHLATTMGPSIRLTNSVI